MNPETNPYIPAAGSRPPALVGRDQELDAFAVALSRLGKGVHARSMILDGVRGVGKTVLLREFNYLAREHGWITSGVVECDADEDLRRIVAKLCHRALRDLDKRRTAGAAVRRAFGVLKAFTFALEADGRWHFNIDFDAIKGVADSGDPEVDIVELLGEVGRAASEHGEGVLMLLDEMQLLSKGDLGLLTKAVHQISQEVLPVLIAGAGLPQLPLMLKEHKLYAERLFTFRTIASLRPAQAAKALVVPAAREDVSYTADALGYILDQSQGYPYFLQQWGEAVWNEAEASPIGMEDALAAHELVTDELDRRFFRDRYDTATEAERIYMAAMADLGPGPHSSADIAARMGLTVKGASVRRDGLLKKGLIYSGVDSELDFTVPQFAAFITRIHPFDAAQRPRRGRPPRANRHSI
ncbi:MAG: ATP-binding protein [Solirubrobacteraceae bacterium]